MRTHSTKQCYGSKAGIRVRPAFRACRYTESDLESPECDVGRFVPVSSGWCSLPPGLKNWQRMILPQHSIMLANRPPSSTLTWLRTFEANLANCLTTSHFSRRARGERKKSRV